MIYKILKVINFGGTLIHYLAILNTHLNICISILEVLTIKHLKNKMLRLLLDKQINLLMNVLYLKLTKMKNCLLYKFDFLKNLYRNI